MQFTQRSQALKQNTFSHEAVFRWTNAAKGVKKQFSLNAPRQCSLPLHTYAKRKFISVLISSTMGDKSPKSVNKQKTQKQKQAGAATQKKQDSAPKSGAPAKKK